MFFHAFSASIICVYKHSLCHTDNCFFSVKTVFPSDWNNVMVSAIWRIIEMTELFIIMIIKIILFRSQTLPPCIIAWSWNLEISNYFLCGFITSTDVWVILVHLDVGIIRIPVPGRLPGKPLTSQNNIHCTTLSTRGTHTFLGQNNLLWNFK